VSTFYAWIGALAQRGVLPSDFQYPFLIRGFLCVLVLAPILGGLSHLVVTRRMAFFSAALGQAAITGVALGLLLGEPLNAPYGGMFGFCLLSTLAMVYVKRHATLPPDTLIGVFHALTLGLGFLGIVFGEQRRGWEDRFAGTDVLYDERRPEPAPWSRPEPPAPASTVLDQDTAPSGPSVSL